MQKHYWSSAYWLLTMSINIQNKFNVFDWFLAPFNTTMSKLFFLYYFSNSFGKLKDLQYLNLSYNSVQWIKMKQCYYNTSRKIRETFDISNNGANVNYILRNGFFSNCAQFKHIYLKNNEIYDFNKEWNIFHKSLRVLDLSNNKISELNVSNKNKYFI